MTYSEVCLSLLFLFFSRLSPFSGHVSPGECVLLLLGISSVDARVVYLADSTLGAWSQWRRLFIVSPLCSLAIMGWIEV